MPHEGEPRSWKVEVGNPSVAFHLEFRLKAAFQPTDMPFGRFWDRSMGCRYLGFGFQDLGMWSLEIWRALSFLYSYTIKPKTRIPKP